MKRISNNRVRSVSVVTVCLNTRDTIRMTLESVARQTYPDVRHVIVDGGSTDGTLDIIREYDPAYLVSEMDDGIYHAMDKGAQAANGDLLIFLNAGDTFFDDEVCARVAEFAQSSRADIVFGDLLPVRIYPSDHSDHGAFEEGKLLNLGYMLNRKYLYNESIHHQATFYRRWVFDKGRYHCAEEHASGEYNLLLDAVFSQNATVKYISRPISRFALGGTSTRDFEKEWVKYSRARETLRGLYMPDFDAINLKNEHEFHTPATASLATKAARRLKTGIRKSPVFGLYSRIANSIAGRASNAVTPELRNIVAMEVRAALNEVTNHAEANVARQVAAWTEFEKRQNETEAQQVIKWIEFEKRQNETEAQQVIKWTEFEKRQNERFESLDDSTKRLSTAFERQLKALQSSLASSVESLKDGLTRARIEGSARHQVIVQHSLKQLDATLDKMARNAARMAEATGMFEHNFGSGFSGYSQWDEDGVLQYLIRQLPIEDRSFVEFGVGDYNEANTRLLLVKDDWSGLVIDNDTDRLTFLRNSELAWRYPLAIQEDTVEPDNINEILINQGISGQIGLLSIDIDGMDYWVWQSIEAIEPAIVICEYNALWGNERAVTVPYDSGFDRTEAHFSWQYAGASITALRLLGEKKGYALVCVNSGGNNAFFVRKDLLKGSAISADPEAFRAARFREGRNEDGSLSFAPPDEVRACLGQFDLLDIESGDLIKVEDLQ